MSKFVGKFRKNREYGDDGNFTKRKRSKSEHSEIRKIKNHTYDQFLEEFEDKEFVKFQQVR